MDKKDKYDLDDLKQRIRFKELPYDIPYNYKRLQANIENKQSIQAGAKSYRLWRIVGIAASLALLVMVTVQFIMLYSSKEMVWYEITAVPDAKTRVVLPDSSTVWLNANASLRYPRTFSADKRTVTVSGDALFEVRKDEKPFFVELDGLKIKVLGTVFNVITDKKEDEIEVTLMKGKIALYSNQNHTDIPDRILVPNQQAIYFKTVRDISVASIRTDAVTSWVTGSFRFQGNTLTEIVTELERAFHVKIHIENEEMKQKTFNANFEDKETLEEILSILQISARYTIEKRRGEIYIN